VFSIKEIDSKTLSEWQQEGRPIRLIDVRSVTEFSQGMIKDGEQLPLHLLPMKANELTPEAEIVFYCRSGARSAQACAYMASKGHESVYNLRGGIIDWVRNGFGIVQPNVHVA
jgi:rhodanese-related sulfurtransferase